MANKLKIIFRNKLFLIGVSVFLLAELLAIGGLMRQLSNPSQVITPSPVTAVRNQETEVVPQVLGHYGRSPQIFLSGGREGYGGGGMIALSSTDEPTVQIGGYNISGTAEVAIYEANEHALLDYLTHDSEGKQTKREPDRSTFRYVTTVNQQVTSGYGKETKLLLPINELGIWFLEVKLSETKEYAYVVRSKIGVLVKEGDNEYIFWGQDFKSKRSISDGELRLYNLENGRQEIAYAVFSSEGIARTALLSDADIALVRLGDDRAVVPINLEYLNYGGSFKQFQPKQRQTKYFIFTDRPLYRPGDTVYYKGILRDDDDARYSIPTGIASVKVYRNWDEKDAVFDKNVAISGAGAVFGEVKLPVDIGTGYYQLKVSVAPPTGSQDRGWYWEDNTASFQIEYFRKPEYSIDITTPVTELVSGDSTSFTVSGNYFSGQPLANQQVKYTVYAGDFYDYEYVSDRSNALTNDYRYGYWGGSKVAEGQVTFDGQGKVTVPLDTKVTGGKSQVYSIEADFDDGSGSPAFSRKNILVYAGEFGIYRKEASYTSKVGVPHTLPVIISSHRGGQVGNIELAAQVLRTNWVSYQDPNQKYPSYRKEEEKLPDIKAKTDPGGNATFHYIPEKLGSYQFIIEGKDRRGNSITKTLYAYVASEDQPYYTGEHNNELTIQADKATYDPIDTAQFTVFSQVPDRDVFLSFDRARVNRFQIVKMQGKTARVNMALASTDIPNIFAAVTSFSNSALDTGSTNVMVSTETKKLMVTATSDRTTYGPGDTVTVNVATTDAGGNPVAAEAAVWTVDKALFELVNSRTANIFETFWRERYNDTQTAHSLEGIPVQTAERGGGCFAEETPILMDDFSTKFIKEIKIGDTILTRKSETNAALVKAKVIRTHTQEESGYLIFNQTLRVTPNHRLWVNDKWREAGSIQIGDELRDQNDRQIKVSSIEWQRGNFTVYNLEVENYNTFFAGGVWVHNQKGDGGRTVFKDTAYWNPTIQTGSDGRAKVTFKLPDNLTTWVVAAIGASIDTQVGQTTSELLVTKDVIVRPILPNILRVGDQVVLSALVQNFTDADHAFDIDLSLKEGSVAETTHSGILIKSKGTEQLYWQVRAEKENEKAKLRFSARAQDEKKVTDTITQELPVREFGFWEKRGVVGDGPTALNVKLAPDSHPEKSTVTLMLAPTLVGMLPTAMKYLIHYPYGCVEQTTSSFVPAVIAKVNPDLFGESLADKNLDEIIQKGVWRLAQQQQSDGGWTWWFSGQSDLYVTTYVLEHLLRAREVGVNVDQGMLTRAQQFITTTSVSVDPQTGAKQALSPVDTVVKEYALTLWESEREPEQITYFENLTPDILALAVITNVRNGDTNPATNGLTKLISLAKTQGDGVYWEAGTKAHFSSQDAATAWAIRAILEAQGDREFAVKAVRFLSRNRRYEYWSNTYSTAQVIKALVDFSKTGAELSPNYTYSVELGGKTLKTGVINQVTQMIEVNVPISQLLPAGSSITLAKSGEGQLYSTLLVNEFHTDKNAANTNHGLKVERKYVNDKGEEYTLAVGDTVRVEITVSGLSAEELYGVIADELPAGLVPINPVFKNEQYGENRSAYYSSYDVSDREVTENGIVLSLYRLGAGTRTYSYKARVVSEGIFAVPPATASLMYAPEVYGRSGAEVVKVGKVSQFIPKPARPAPELSGGERSQLVPLAAVLLLVLLGGVLIKRKPELLTGLKALIHRRPRPPSDSPPPSGKRPPSPNT